MKRLITPVLKNHANKFALLRKAGSVSSFQHYMAFRMYLLFKAMWYIDGINQERVLQDVSAYIQTVLFHLLPLCFPYTRQHISFEKTPAMLFVCWKVNCLQKIFSICNNVACHRKADSIFLYSCSFLPFFLTSNDACNGA